MDIRKSLILVLFVARILSADEGELTLGLSSAPGYVWSQNPIDEAGVYSGNFVSPYSINIRYGLSDTWRIGSDISFVFAYWPFSSEGSQVGQTHGGMSFNYFAMHFPLVIGYRFDNGYDYSSVVEMFGGYSFSSWENNYLLQNKLTALGKEELEQSFVHGYNFGLNLLFETRFFDWFLLEVGPQYQASYMRGWSHFFGLLIRASGALGVGTLLGAQ
jgi:hypothetical protein